MIASSRLRRRNAHVLRSQVALELALTLLAVVAGLLLLRTLLLAAGIDEQSWSRSALSVATGPLVLPLQAIPGGSRTIIGSATLADVTAAVLLLAVPIFVLSRPARG